MSEAPDIALDRLDKAAAHVLSARLALTLGLPYHARHEAALALRDLALVVEYLHRTGGGSPAEARPPAAGRRP